MVVTSSPQARRGGSVRSWAAHVRAALASDRARLFALSALVVLVAFTGGASRSDVVSLMILRPAAVLFSVYAALVITSNQLRLVRAPLLIVVALMFLALLQLAPLPPALWATLPSHELVAGAAADLGMENLYRPLSVDPNRTWNTFFALFVPLAAVCLVAIQSPRHRQQIVPLLVAVGLLSASVGFLQAIGGNGLYLYDITHRGYPVGLFANKNHQSIMLLWLMITGSWMAATADRRGILTMVTFSGAVALIIMLFPLLVLTGSRAGLLLSLPALSLCCWLLFQSPTARAMLRRPSARARLVVAGVIAAIFVPLISVLAVLVVSGRTTALSRLFELQAFEDLRWQYSVLFWRMIQDFMPLGSGFGSFENAFNMYEPSEMLTASYMNQAHNDLAQLLIEGGLPAFTILIVALAWLARAGWRLWRSPERDGRADAAFLVGSMMLWLTASLVDYPLRTPLSGMLVAALTALLAIRSTAHHSSWFGEATGSSQPGTHRQ